VADTDSSADRKSRLHSLEEGIKEALWLALGIEERTCARCGEEKPLRPAAQICAACRERQQAEANRANQRRRRQWEKTRRQLAAGHLEKGPYFIVPVRVTCAHCGGPFRPARSSGRYCSTRCRVASYREKKQ
jgi:hypothetical protein